jgi:hypothetical protein
MQIDDRIDSISRRPFRPKFRPRGRERAIVQLRGMIAVSGHAAELEPTT